ncbi:uncharacterized protein VNE69_01169 [Vairimorpha necatrix]|uniref:Uncharacterized protein n=1 Tax=Vairimorpha necatrix TaxID=6039 RepID=A0AAX4J8I9_9MICR
MGKIFVLKFEHIITKKTEIKDFTCFNYNEIYCKVTISHSGPYCCVVVNLGGIVGIFDIPLIYESDETTNEYRKIENIAKDIEKKLYEIDMNINKYCIIFIYKQNEIENYKIMNDLITHIKKINLNRKVVRRTELYYDFIFEDKCLLKRRIIDRDESMIYSQSSDCLNVFKDSSKLKKQFYCFTIEFYKDDVSYFFEVYDKDFTVKCSNTLDKYYSDDEKKKELNKHVNELFEFLGSRERKKYKFYKSTTIKKNMIKNKDLLFKINIKTKKIVFKQSKGTYIYSYKNDTKSGKNITHISRECFNDFCKILKFISKNKKNWHEYIGVLYKFLETSNLVKFFINKILDKEDSAINIFFKHICLNLDKKILNNVEIITKDKYLDQTEKNKLTEAVVQYLSSKDKNQFIKCMIKFCFFFEGENIIRDNIEVKNTIFKTLNEIRNIILIDALSIRPKIKRKKDKMKKNVGYLTKICREVYSGLRDIKQYNKNSKQCVELLLKLFEEPENSIYEIKEGKRDSFRGKRIKEFINLNDIQDKIFEDIKEKIVESTQ